jgi:hypothetical protein
MTEIYGVGAFLLAGSEVYKLALLKDVEKAIVKVSNPISSFRDNETISLDWKKLKEKVSLKSGQEACVFDCKHNRFLLTQPLDTDADGETDEFLFQSDFGPGETKIFWIAPKKKGFKTLEPENRAFCMFVPQRKDDFAWENDRIAFRMYGPALQASGEISSGVDVWVKKVRYPILKKWYKINDYHKDHGEGLDFYKVGPSRGCGGVGIYKDGNLYVSENYTEWKIFANGPIRTIFELNYTKWEAEDHTVREIKRISLDLGSNLSRFESRFYVLKGKKDIPVAVGTAKRENDGVVTYNLKDKWMGYWQPEDNINGIIGCGVVMSPAQNVSFADELEHGLFITGITEKSQFVYYAGAGWDRGLDYSTREEWEIYLKNFTERIQNPLHIKIFKRGEELWK